MKRAICAIVLTITTSCTLANTIDNISNTAKTVSSILDKYIHSNEPGCSVVVTDGVNSHFSSKGLASLEYGATLSAQTKMLTASTSKQFLGYAVLQLVNQGKLNLDDNLGKLLPAFKNYSHIKLHQLLNHTSGVRSHWAIFELMGKSLFDQYQPSLVTEILTSAKLDFEPNNRYLYSNGGYFLLTKVLEEVTQQPFAQYMKQAIFNPLGMTDTEYLDDYKRVIVNRADGYMKSEAGEFVAMRTHSEIIGPGHIITTAHDFAKWANYLLSLDLEQFFTHLKWYSKSKDGGQVNYFAGLFKEKYNGDLVYQHAGYYENWRQGFSLYPERNLAIVSLCNRADISTNKLGFSLAEALLNWEDANNEEKSYLNKSNVGIYFSKKLNELISIRAHKGSLYYISPANSSYAQLIYNAKNKSYKGLTFKQNNSFIFSKNGLVFHSPIVTGEFTKLNFNINKQVSDKIIGKYKHEGGLGIIDVVKSDKGIKVTLEHIGELEYLPTHGDVWVDLENLSTIVITEQDNKTMLNLSLKHIKSLQFFLEY